MSNPSIQDLIRNNLTIPTLPDMVLRINALIEDPDAGTAEIGALVAEDAPLAAKVLRIANSAYYGLSGECVSTAHASTVLGIKVLKNIVTQVAVIQQFDHLEGNEHFSLRDLWDHAGLTAHLCSKAASLSSLHEVPTPEELYVCGLLHDVGKVVLMDGLGQDYLELARIAGEHGRSLQQVERARLGFTHSDVGAVVAQRWGLPEPIIRAIQFHHGPRQEVAGDVVVSIVAHANLLAHRVKAGDLDGAGRVLDDGTRGQLGLSEAASEELLEFAAANRHVRVR